MALAYESRAGKGGKKGKGGKNNDGNKGDDNSKDPLNQSNRKPHRKGSSKSTSDKHQKAQQHGGRRKIPPNPNKRQNGQSNFHITSGEVKGALIVGGVVVAAVLAAPLIEGLGAVFAL